LGFDSGGERTYVTAQKVGIERDRWWDKGLGRGVSKRHRRGLKRRELQGGKMQSKRRRKIKGLGLKGMRTGADDGQTIGGEGQEERVNRQEG